MKKYNKHYVKRNPSDNTVRIDGGKEVDDKIVGGKPVLGDIRKKDIPLDDSHVEILNRSWKKTGVFYAETKDDSAEIEKALRIELFAKASVLLANGKIEKAPAKNIKTIDLQTLINNITE